MNLVERYGIREAPSCEGHVVVVDVLRASTTAAFAFYRGAREIILVATPEEAFAIGARSPRAVLVGEVSGRKIDGFDFGNSPEQIDGEDFTGRTIILRSSSGTQSVTQAVRATKRYLGSLVVASSTVRYLLSKNVPLTTILASGSIGGLGTDEDVACRDYFMALFSRKSVDKRSIVERVRTSPAGRQALDPAVDFKSPGDLDRATQVDRFDFLMPVEENRGLLVAKCQEI